MAFTEPVEVVDLENTFLDGDNVVDDSVEFNIDIEGLSELLSMTSEDEDSRIRTIHKENVIVKEQDYTSVNIPEDCLNCVKKALGKYNKKANTISSKIITILADGKVSETEFISGAMTIVKELGDVGSFDMISISSKLWGCKKDCENTELKQ